MESLLRDLTPPSTRTYTPDELARVIEILSEALGQNVAAQATGDCLSKNKLEASRRLILVSRRIAYAARHPGESA